TNAHPDFLWTPVKDARALSQADKYTPGSWGKNALVPTNWTRVAKKASEYGIPLAKVVEGLVKRSSK
ncbi:MAG: peptidase, partial [Bdellovibrionales bacterium]|nr:peptidase [Bdellovibrionales bacterium]